MFCQKCGQPLADDAKFCEKCGAPVEVQDFAANMNNQNYAQQPDPYQQPGACQPNSGAPQDGQMPYQPMPQKPAGQTGKKIGDFIKSHGLLLGIAVAVIAIVIGVVVFLNTRPITVKLNDYIKADFYGYDTQGKVNYIFELDKFTEDYSGKIKLKKSKMSDMYEGLDSMMKDDPEAFNHYICQNFRDQCISGHIEPTEKLSNGDEVTFVWSCSDEKAKELYNVKLSYEDIQFTVEGLDEPTVGNPLDELIVEYQGVAPFGEAVLNRANIPEYAYYNLSSDVDKMYGLSNGDVITARLSGTEDKNVVDRILSEYGMVIGETEKQFTVEGLPTLAAGLADIDEDTLAAVQAQAEDDINAQIAEDWDEEWELKKVEFQGYHFLFQKATERMESVANRLYAVYKVSAHVTIPDDEIDEDFSYYACVYFDNLIRDTDGNMQLNLDESGMVSNRFYQEFPEYHVFYFEGYPDLDSLFKECVTTNIGDYSYETTINK